MIIKWTNRYSGEVGYVKSIDYRNKHFNNTFDIAEAKDFSKESTVKKAIDKLVEYGENENNTFEVI